MPSSRPHGEDLIEKNGLMKCFLGLLSRTRFVCRNGVYISCAQSLLDGLVVVGHLVQYDYAPVS